MRKLFAEHPVFSVLLTSCVTTFLVIVLSFGFFFFVLIKGLGAIAEQIDATNVKKTSEYTYIAGNSTSQNKLLSVKIDGVIYSSKSANDPFDFLFPGITYGYTVKEILINAANDPDIKGVILEIDSPGGTINGSKAIYDGITYYKEKTGKPILAFIEGIGASGAYMSAIGADFITADYGSLTGSIGVIMGPFKYYNGVVSESDFVGSVVTENGIEYTYITGGEDKEFGSPYKPLSEKALTTMQENVNREYEKFVELVAVNRDISKSMIIDEIGALVYENTQAKELGLIDDVESKNNSYSKLADMAKVSETDYQVVSYRQTDFWSALFAGVFTELPKETTQCGLCNQMLYLYGDQVNYINK